MADAAGSLHDATARLLDELRTGARPLTAISATLSRLRDALVVDRVVVAVDDEELGRQVFSSGRAPIRDDCPGLWGPPAVCTEPERTLDDRDARLLVSAVGFGLAAAVRASPALPLQARPAVDELHDALTRATSVALRHGWAFTLVLVRLDHSDPTAGARVRAHVRSGDVVVPAGPCELALVLPATSDDRVPALLARLVRAGLGRLAYGLAACPGDRTEASALAALAAARLDEADSARTGSGSAGPSTHPDASRRSVAAGVQTTHVRGHATPGT